LTITHLL